LKNVRLPGKLRHPAFAVLVVGSLLVSLLLLSTFQSTPPPLAVIAGPLTGWMVALFLPSGKAAAGSDASSRPGDSAPAVSSRRQ